MERKIVLNIKEGVIVEYEQPNHFPNSPHRSINLQDVNVIEEIPRKWYMAKNKYYWKLEMAKSKYIMCSDSDKIRKFWILIMHKAKQTSDSIKCIQRIYNSCNSISLSQNYTNNEKMMMRYYLIKFSRVEIESVDLEDINFSELEVNLPKTLGYSKCLSESSDSKQDLNGSFEVPLPVINILDDCNDLSRNPSKSSNLTSVEKGKQSNVLHLENDPAFITPKRCDLIDSDSEEDREEIIDIQIVRKAKIDSPNEEEKEENTSASETLVREVDCDGEEIKFESFKLIERLGKGNFGEVFKAVLKKEEHKVNHKTYALKAMKKSQIIGNNQLKYVTSECSIMKKLCSPFIVSLYFAFQTPKFLYLAMEYCGGKDLSWHLDKLDHLSEERTKLCIAEIILAIEYLHSKDIIYRDLKPSNVMVSSDGHIKLTDFGLAKEGVIGMDYARTFCGSPAYLAPELIKDRKFNKSSDIYQIGVLMFELLTGKPPFYKSSRESLFNCIKNSYNLEVPSYVNTITIDLLGRLLNKIPDKRIGVKSFDDLKNHQFFENIDWSLLSEKNFVHDGIFTQDEIKAANCISQDVLDFDEQIMCNLEHKVDFYDEDFNAEEIKGSGSQISKHIKNFDFC